MNVAQFIDWLKTQDQEATVEVIKHFSGKGYYDQGGNIETTEFDPTNTDLWTYTDMRGNQFSVGKPWENKRTLLLGGENL